jgi:hypothetical protein
MQAMPAHRYQSADEMLVDIESVQRTVYKPAGQTELKRWLAALQEHDHCPTISHPSAAQPPTSENEAFDIGAGAEVVFDESNLIDVEDVLDGIQPTIAAIPDQAVALRPRSEEKTTAATPVALGQSRIPARIIVFASIVSALAVGAWLAMPSSRHVPAKPDHNTQPKHPSLVEEPSPKTNVMAVPIPVVVDAGAKHSVDTGSSATTGAAAAATPAPLNEEEEENLLKNAEPDDRERVLGEDEGVRIAKKPSLPSRSGGLDAVPVSVRVVSTPEGAVVSLGKRVFGRAPMNLRFRPGITFELGFVKKGYSPATKRFTATGKKNQTVRVTLKKKPVAKKSLFHRIFGGR